MSPNDTIEISLRAPDWLVTASIVVTSILALSQIVKLYLNRRGYLEIRLTRETFFRLGVDGECLFMNAVILSRNGPVEIRAIEFLLKRLESSQKQYTLSLSNIGTKVIDYEGNLAKPQFFTTSPISFINKDSAERYIFRVIQSEYRNEISKLINDYILEMKRYRDQLMKEVTESTDKPTSTKEDLYKHIKGEAEKRSLLIMTRVQLEGGRYEASVNVTYKPLGWRKSTTVDQAKSKIQFDVTSDFHIIFKGLIEDYLLDVAEQIVTRGEKVPTLPEYEPINVIEL